MRQRSKCWTVAILREITIRPESLVLWTILETVIIIAIKCYSVQMNSRVAETKMHWMYIGSVVYVL